LKAIDAKDEAEPVLAALAEAGPADGAAQHHGLAGEAALLEDLPAQAGDHVLARLELAAQAVVLAEVGVTLAAVAVNHQDAPAVRGDDVAQGGDDRRKRHGISARCGRGGRPCSGPTVRLVCTWSL